MNYKLGFVVAVIFCFGQCKTKTLTTSNTPNTNTNTNIQKYPLRVPISRGTIRVMAEIVKVKPINKESKDTPCREHPCEATIKIVKVVDTGAFFEGEIKQGQSIDAYFVSTLMPTQDIYPQKQVHLPGLKSKDNFQADIVYNPNAATVPKYSVVSYNKK